MNKVLVAVRAEWQARLADSVLWRNGLEWVNAEDAATAYDIARASKPRLVLLDAQDPDVRDAMLRFRKDKSTRNTAIVVLLRVAASGRADEMKKGGANAVLTEQDDAHAWDECFEKLLGTPPRRELRVPVVLTIWARPEEGAGASVVGDSVNLSVSGVLVETAGPLAIGTMLNLSFRLPAAAEELRLVGRVVWTTPILSGRYRSGVSFRKFHGQAMQAILNLFYEARK
jgi:CheY-like chemotaxis protein